ncbi:MAG TPA: hypothetical protein VJH23_00245 [archaeon]|nr:hypothetical protein [archaeon]
MAKKNLAICIPSGRHLDFAFFSSFAATIGQIMLGWNSAVFTVASPIIFENRNEIVRRVLDFESKSGMKFDYMLWLDNDIMFTFENIKTLLAHLDSGDGFISGVYYNPKNSGILPVAYWKDGDNYKWLEEKELHGVMEVDAVGFGFCAMKTDLMRGVFAKYAPRPFNMRQLDNGSLVTEDQIFCERAKELGAKIILDTSIVVKHAKGYLPR